MEMSVCRPGTVLTKPWTWQHRRLGLVRNFHCLSHPAGDRFVKLTQTKTVVIILILTLDYFTVYAFIY